MKKATLLFLFTFTSSILFSQSLVDLYDKVSSSVVVIKTISKSSLGHGDKQNAYSAEGLGSGVLVSYDGLIWTASHVVHNADKLIVIFNDGDIYEAEVLSSNPIADVALIKISSVFHLRKKHIANIGNSDETKIGEDIFIIGSPHGIEQTLSRGIVSGKMSQGDDFLPVEFIQTDAAINPGNSGGPMFNMKGEIIGIASFILSESGGFNGIGFGVSSNVTKKILMEQSKFWSGIEYVFLKNEMADIFNLPQAAGILITSVNSKGLGHKIGLRGGYVNATIEGSPLLIGGDILLEIAGVKLINYEALISIRKNIISIEKNKKYTVTYLRAGKVYTTEVINK